MSRKESSSGDFFSDLSSLFAPWLSIPKTPINPEDKKHLQFALNNSNNNDDHNNNRDNNNNNSNNNNRDNNNNNKIINGSNNSYCSRCFSLMWKNCLDKVRRSAEEDAKLW